MKTQKQEDPPVEPIDEEVITPEPNKKKAFFITPLGSDDSTIRRNTNGIINAVLRPVLRELDIHLIPPHEIDNPGNITKQVIREILTADLVIADLTGLNANVMYELAVRHAKRLPVIVIAQIDTKLPFDIAAERTIFYQNDMAGSVQLIEQLRKTIPKALDDDKPDNPIYNGLESLSILEKVEKNSNTFESYIIEKLDELTDTVSILRNRSSFQQPTKVDNKQGITDASIVILKPGDVRDIEKLVDSLKKYSPNLANINIIVKSSSPFLVERIRFTYLGHLDHNRLLQYLKSEGFDDFSISSSY